MPTGLLDYEVPGKFGIYDKPNETVSQVRPVQVSENNGFIFNILLLLDGGMHFCFKHRMLFLALYIQFLLIVTCNCKF